MMCYAWPAISWKIGGTHLQALASSAAEYAALILAMQALRTCLGRCRSAERCVLSETVLQASVRNP